jgi:hypothetical protein
MIKQGEASVALRNFSPGYVSNGSFSTVLPAGRARPPTSAAPLIAAVLSMDGCSSVSAKTGREQMHNPGRDAGPARSIASSGGLIRVADLNCVFANLHDFILG